MRPLFCRAAGPVAAFAAVLLIVSANAVGTAQPASAQQGILQFMFGQNSAPPPPAPVQAARHFRPGELLRPQVVGTGLRQAQTMAPKQQRADRLTNQYRTLCVRTCDGFFFPVSSQTTRNRFHADQARCEKNCPGAKLFVQRAHAASIEEATDLSGRPYRLMPTAFLHRKRLVDNCSCRPEPWSEAEKIRHEIYAANEVSMTPAGKAVVIAGSTDRVETSGIANGENTGATEATVAPEGEGEVTVTATVEQVPVRPAAMPRVTAGTQPVTSSQSIGTSSAVAPRRPVNAQPRPTAPQAVAGKSKAGPALFAGLGSQSAMTWPGDNPRR